MLVDHLPQPQTYVYKKINKSKKWEGQFMIKFSKAEQQQKQHGFCIWSKGIRSFIYIM